MIAEQFHHLKARDEMALIPYLVAGYPKLDASLDALDQVAAAGADLVEIGVPFSDPVADGATIQRASHAALMAGFRLDRLLDALPQRRISQPILLMSYLNPLLAIGRERLLDRLEPAGIRGLIIPDLPAEEADDWLADCRAAGQALTFLVAPTTAPDRLRRIAERCDGFLYAVSLAGTTGERDRLDPGLPDYLARIRAVTDRPIAVGFGISRPEQITALRGHADGVIVGSRLVAAIERGEKVNQLVRELKNATRSEVPC